MTRFTERENRIRSVFPSTEIVEHDTLGSTVATVRVIETMPPLATLVARLGAESLRIGSERGEWVRIIVTWREDP